MTTLVYRYGLKAPTENESIVREQMWLAHRYRNDLVAIARGERAVKRAVIAADLGVIEATAIAVEARTAVVAAHQAIETAHVLARKREHSQDLRDALADAKKSYVDALKALTAARRAAFRTDEARAEFARIDALANGALPRDGGKRREGGIRKHLLEHCGVWWGTYALVGAAVDQSLRRVLGPGKAIALPLWDGLDESDPRFERWRECTPAVGAYNNAGPNGTSDKFVQIDGNTIRMKLSRDAWGSWPIKLHRPLPRDARISAVRIICRREGPAEQWEALLTLTTQETRARTDLGHVGEPDVCGIGQLSVDIGWRSIDGELRVARWRDDRGESGEIRLTAQMIERLRRASEIHAGREQLFNCAKLALGWFIAGLDAPPAWLPRLHVLFDWRAPERLARLCCEWRERRFVGDESICRILDDWTPGPYTAVPWRGHDESWRRRDKHLWHMEAAIRAKALAHREDFYRVIAARFARQYDKLVIEKFDIRDVAKVPELESRQETEQRRLARAQRHLVAVSELRSALVHAFTGRGGSVVEVDPAQSTHECPACNAVTDFDAAASIRWTCRECGAEWDQDDSAAQVLLQRSERSGSRENAAIARDTAKPATREKKWTRIAREKQERSGRIETESRVARQDGDAASERQAD